ncbi:MAG: sigma-E processing peptidase SpoIIGA [Bacillota bacterium]
MGYIYIDVLFLVNAVVDYALLWLVGHWLHLDRPWWQRFVAALVGGGYASLQLYLPVSILYSLLGKLACSIAMVAIAFRPTGLRNLVQGVTLFYLVAFLLAGAATAVGYLGQSAPGWADSYWGGQATPGLLLLGLVLVAVGGRVLVELVARRERNYSRLIALAISGREVTLRALVDTGNRLRDPFSDSPVAIVEYREIGGLLPAGVQQVYERGWDDDFSGMADLLSSSSEWGTRFRLVPFQSIGRINGMLLGFRPSRFAVLSENGQQQAVSAIVCIYDGRLSSDGSYQALIPAELAALSL